MLSTDEARTYRKVFEVPSVRKLALLYNPNVENITHSVIKLTTYNVPRKHSCSYDVIIFTTRTSYRMFC
jgi:hypothetical protein